MNARALRTLCCYMLSFATAALAIVLLLYALRRDAGLFVCVSALVYISV